MINIAPIGPWRNPSLEEGCYDAVIEEITELTDGKEGQKRIRLVFTLPSREVYFVTNLYFRPGESHRAEQRLWFFCRCVGLTKDDFLHQQELFIGRKLMLAIRAIHPDEANYGEPYSDVWLFHPPPPEEEPEGGM